MNETSGTTNPPTARTDLRSHLARTLLPLQAAHLSGEGRRAARASATLAQLRHLDPARPASEPALYELIFEGLPASLTWSRDEPSRGELAVASALHLYAVHQQGRGEAMHVKGLRFGTAVRQLAVARGVGGKPSEGVLDRFDLLVRTSSPGMRIVHLRSLIGQLRGARIGLDHVQLGEDLYELMNPRTAPHVHLRWARDFHHRSTTPSSEQPLEAQPPIETEQA